MSALSMERVLAAVAVLGAGVLLEGQGLPVGYDRLLKAD